MRFRLSFSLENEYFPIQYHKSIMSFIKLSLTQYNQEYFERLYHAKDNIIKPYTFAVFFRNPEFKEENIIIKDKRFEVNLSIEDYEIAIALYNALNHQKLKKFSINKNSWTLQNISMMLEKQITKDILKVKFISPLVARKRENEKDYYYSFKDSEFIDTLKINIKEELKITNLEQKLVEEFNIQEISGKKVIVKFYEKKIECTLGTFKISGDKRLLEYLYKAGAGSKRSSGFGMFEILD